jgi:hypothetical protein
MFRFSGGRPYIGQVASVIAPNYLIMAKETKNTGTKSRSGKGVSEKGATYSVKRKKGREACCR